MYIVYNNNNAIDSLRSKYLVLELDTFEINGNEPLTAFAVVDSSHIPFDEIPKMEEHKELHANLIKNYRQQNWNYCRQAMEHLRGKFRGELDTFYDELEKRIAELEKVDLGDDWTGNVVTSQSG